jgi:hypothetical protein
MNRIEELKQQNPHYGKSIIDLLSHLLDKPKYVEMTIKLIKEKESNHNYTSNIILSLYNDFGIPKEKVEALNLHAIHFDYLILDSIGRNTISNLIKFVEYNERKLISQNDLSQYSNFSEIENQLSLVELKLIDKEMAKQTRVMLDTEEWLVLKPLSFEASLKYGAATKWCTAMRNDSEYFARYSKRGILIYCMNKLTGEKIAAFKNLNLEYDPETSFWNAADTRIDSMDTNLPFEVLDVIKFEFKTMKTTNWDLMPQEVKSRLEPQIKSYGIEAAIRDERERNLVDAVQNLGREQVMDEELPCQEESVNESNDFDILNN